MLTVLSLNLLTRLQPPLRKPQHQATLKHERHATLSNLLRLQHRIARPLKAVCIRPMRRHDVVKTGTSWLKASTSLGVVFAADESHEFGHGVAVVPRGPECVFLD